MSNQFTVKLTNPTDNTVELAILPIEYKALPFVLLESLLRYEKFGDKRYGDFIRACLENNLQMAFGYWDEVNFKSFHLVVKFIYNQLPMGCWGSAVIVNKWKGLDNMISTVQQPLTIGLTLEDMENFIDHDEKEEVATSPVDCKVCHRKPVAKIEGNHVRFQCQCGQVTGLRPTEEVAKELWNTYNK